MKKNCVFVVLGVYCLMLSVVSASNCPPGDQLNVTTQGTNSVSATVAENLKTKVSEKFNDLAVDVQSITDDCNAALDQWVAEYSEDDSAWWDVFNQKKNQLLQDLQAKIADASSQLTQKITQIGDDVSTGMASALIDVSPVVGVDAEYDYCREQFNPGDPGWKINGPPFVTGFTGVQASGNLSLDFTGSISFSIELVSFSFNVVSKVSGSMAVDAEIIPRTPSTPSPLGNPTATVSVGNTLKFTGSGSVSGQQGVIGGGSNLSVSTTKDLGLVTLNLVVTEPGQ